MSALDRFWSAVARIASNRVTKREAVWKGGEVHRLTADWLSALRSADEEVKRDQRQLRARARDLARNNPYAKQFLRLLKLNVIGPVGFGHQAQVRNNDGRLAKAINDRIEGAWAEWATNVTLDRRMSLVEFEKQQQAGEARDGEALIRKWRGTEFNPYGLALEAIDADLLDHEMNQAAGRGSGNEIRMGIEIDQRNRRVAYHVFEGKYDALRVSRRVRIPAEDIIHLYDPERSNQTRGVTWFHPVMLAMHVLDAYVDSELYASRISASTMAVWVRKEGIVGAGTEQSGSTTPTVSEFNPGTFAFAPDGYGAETINANHPPTAFDPFVKSILREIASGLGITYATLAGDLEATSYSSMKVGKHDEHDLWRSLQQSWCTHFLRPVYAEWMEQARLVGAATGGQEGLALDLRDPRRFLEVRWAPRGWPSPDPLKDRNAQLLGLDRGLIAPQTVVEEEGGDLESTYELIAAARDLAKTYGLDFSAAPAVDGKGVQEKADAEEKDEADDAKKNGKGRDGANRIGALVGRHG